VLLVLSYVVVYYLFVLVTLIVDTRLVLAIAISSSCILLHGILEKILIVLLVASSRPQ
jgi:hypothetical protein